MSSKFKPKEVNVEEVRAHRELFECSLMEAKREISRRRLAECLSELRLNGTLEDKVEFLLDRFQEGVLKQ